MVLRRFPFWEFYILWHFSECWYAAGTPALKSGYTFVLVSPCIYCLITLDMATVPIEPIVSSLKQSSWCMATEDLATLTKDLRQSLRRTWFGWWIGLLDGNWIVYSVDWKGLILFLLMLCIWAQTENDFLHTFNTGILWMPSTRFEHFWLVRPLHLWHTKFD